MSVIDIVAGGASEYSIVLAEDDHRTRFAADELHKYIRRMSGVSLPIVDEERAPAITLRRLGGSSKPDNDGADVSRLRIADDGAVEIAGASAFALLKGVYWFLELAGCRWFAPDFHFYDDRTGSDVPQTGGFAVPAGQFEATPSFRNRKKYIEEARSHTADSLLELIDWMPKVGLNVLNFPTDCFHEGIAVWDDHRHRLVPELDKRGIRLEVGGHGFENFLTSEDLAAHPEWGGLRPDGKREADHGKRTFCTSNHEAMDFFVPRVVAYVDERPEIDVFSLWPPDTTDWCTCAQCAGLGPIELRNALVINAVARAVKETRPDVVISFAAYYEPSRPPEGLDLEDNVAIDFCPITRSYGERIYDPSSALNRQYHELLLSWFETPHFRGEINLYTYYLKYAWRSLPMLLPNLITDELRYYQSLGVVGIGSYAEAGNWWTYELQHYVIARMSFDADTDLDTLLADYLGRRYGHAARHVRDLVRLLEGFLPMVARIPGTTLDSRLQPEYVYEFFRPSARTMSGFERLVGRCRRTLELALGEPGLERRRSRQAGPVVPAHRLRRP